VFSHHLTASFLTFDLHDEDRMKIDLIEAGSSPICGGMGRPARRHVLDGLRAIAVIGVVVYHARTETVGYQLVSNAGWAAVDLFFVRRLGRTSLA